LCGRGREGIPFQVLGTEVKGTPNGPGSRDGLDLAMRAYSLSSRTDSPHRAASGHWRPGQHGQTVRDGYFTTRSDGANSFCAKTSGIYRRADTGDKAVLDGNDADARASLIERRLEEWKSVANS
jgi:hypothetical protein